MKRLAALLLVAGVVAAAAAVATPGENPDARRYFVELDNAFGLVEDGDVKVAGVRAGKIRGLRVDRRTYRAWVEIEIARAGFGDLREDVFCEVRPQSLLGEYFIDCLPGDSSRRLEPGARIPVRQTASTIPLDLINNVMRRPYRERFSIILAELGAALAARGGDLNATIRRASPALRETNKVLATLAEERRVIRDLTDDAERVVGELAGSRRHVARFVEEAGDTQRAVALEAPSLRRQLQRLPVFLRELRPTMAKLGEAADHQAPAVATLAENAPLLERFMNELEPFTRAAQPAFRTLAEAARVGRPAMSAAQPRIGELRSFARDLPELTGNAAIVLEHLHDRRFATEKNPASPGGRGYTGFEAILQYVFGQAQAVNLFDSNSYLLKVSAFVDRLCADYTDARLAREQRQRDRCLAALGPVRPGINAPDPSRTATPAGRRRSGDRPAEERRRRSGERRAGRRPRAEARGDGRRDAERPASGAPLPPPVQQLLDGLDRLPSRLAPERSAAPESLLDFLLAP